MNKNLIGVLLLSSTLAACGGSDNKSASSSSSILSSSSSLSSAGTSSSSQIFSSSSEAGSSNSTSSSSNSSEPASSASSSVSSEPGCNASSTSNLANVSPLSRSVLDGEQNEPVPPATDVPVYVCEDGLYFCDDFASGTTQWSLLPATNNALIPNGSFDVLNDNGNNVLRYTAASTGGVIALVNPASFGGVTSADYYVEARIRPRTNGTTGNKQIYLIARYQDGNNWYAAALNVQTATTSTQIELAKMKAGVITRPLQAKRPLEQGAKDATDGTWYTLRLELIGDQLTVYLDGEKIGTRTDADFTTGGLIGLWTANKSFEIDDIKVGNAADKPAQLTLSPVNSLYSAEVNDDPYQVSVTALAPDGSAGAFTVQSNNPAIVTVSVDGNNVSLIPMGEGNAEITFTSASDAGLTRVITATIAPEFVQPTATYDLACLAYPAPNTTNVHVDTALSLTFDAPPALGDAGAIRIFKADDDSLVDSVKLAYEKDTIGVGATTRSLNTLPIQLIDNTVTIALHSNKLEYNTRYYVAISASVFPDATLAGETFAGIGKEAGWAFTTKAAAPASDATSLTVGKDGATSDFGSVQGALNFAMQNIAKETPAVIEIGDGVYEEMLYVNNKNNLTIRGESRNGVILQYRNSEALNAGTEGRNLFLIANSDNLTLENLTLKNTTLIGEGGQAEAIYFNGQGRLIAKHANFISEQDTLLLKGYSWFYQSLVAGSVDFIWGNNRVALFEESEIRSIGRSSGHANGGYILQARTVNAMDKGFVFLNSQLTRGPGPTNEIFGDNVMWLARSGGSSTYYDNVVFVNTRMDTHIRTAGWANTPAANPATPTAISGWRQYNSMSLNGDPLDISAWVLAYSLSEVEYQTGYSDRAKIFSAYDGGAGWNPQP